VSTWRRRRRGLDCSISQEACSLGLAPRFDYDNWLWVMLGGGAFGTARVKEEDFANLHLGESGQRLARVEALMHSGEAIPRVTRDEDAGRDLRNVAQEAGDDGGGGWRSFAGVISDGDLRRLLDNAARTRST